ncbi:Polycomb group protein EMF2B [Camellia lanceoleosa]|uniref:Polycomb group protein EMF2B n=1 Tax=Camellia lanceoleosa TaxID=1840588 RepID=A0ACC0H4C1_9ERIC|nr:Polycomb group protein EMF2B [Camellia lanceoleosa]
MPGIPLVARETTNSLCNCSYSRGADQMCRPDSRLHLSPEVEIAAEESLSIYCKPVELYNILQRRAVRNPSFLQRCLRYKIQAKHQKRIQMTISLSGMPHDGLQTHRLFPLYILLARPDSNFAVGELKSQILCAIDPTQNHKDMTSFPSNVEGYCLLGKIPMELLYLSWEKSPNLSLGERAEMMSTVDMHSCFMKLSCMDEDKSVAFQMPSGAVHVEVLISAEEVGAKEKSLYNSYSNNDIPTSLSHIMRLRTGNVIFNYRYYNNKLQRTEVTEDFSCPFCLLKCASFKGLRYHLSSSHDLFNFEFWVTDEYQAVNVSVKTDIWRPEIVADGVDPKQQTIFFAQSFADPECVQSVSGSHLAPPTMLQFAKTRKLSIERSDPRNRALLQKRQFFHSHRAQPMELEQALSDRDSEDEVDDDVADFEDRRMLDDFVDVTKDEKQMMHLWNSFVRKQRVLADGHVPWACEAFSKFHGQDLVRAPPLLW